MSTPTPATMAAASLFSASDRTWNGPQRHSQSAYDFLDRSARQPCARVRELLDDWYSHLPLEAKASIRVRFGDAHPGPHLGALWELYLHEASSRLDYEVDLDIGRENPENRRPDFLLASRGERFYLEATAALGASVLGDQASHALAAALREAIERVKAPNFFLGVDVDACGKNTPGRRDVTEPLQRWVDELDPDRVIADYETTNDVPRKVLSFDGWEVKCKAFPVSPEHRDAPDHRVIGTYSEGFAALDDAKPLRRKLKRKAGLYGKLDLPFAVALLCGGAFADDKDIADAQHGNPIQPRDRACRRRPPARRLLARPPRATEHERYRPNHPTAFVHDDRRRRAHRVAQPVGRTATHRRAAVAHTRDRNRRPDHHSRGVRVARRAVRPTAALAVP
jgi:hypothetical protein